MPLRLLQHNAAYLMLFIAPLTWGGVLLWPPVTCKSPAGAPQAGRVPEPVPISFPGPDKRV